MRFGKLLCLYGLGLFAALMATGFIWTALSMASVKSVTNLNDSRIGRPPVTQDPPQPVEVKSYAVRYEATGPQLDGGMGSLDLWVVYLDSAGVIQKVRWVSCYSGWHTHASSWVYNFTGYSGDQIGLAAWDNGCRYWSTVRIYIDGALVAEETSPEDTAVWWVLE